MTSRKGFDPLASRLLFEQPHRLTDVWHWHEHIPLAFLVTELVSPRVFVELGTWKGDSYCAFCQAVSTLKLDTRCYAVDTWVGDEHASYSPEDFEEFHAYHDPVYGAFSSLLKCTFDEALEHFPDESVDLLHIDGHHSYASVHHDYETWRPKLSDCGVVLLHDTNMRERDFGVWKMWDELSPNHPSFEFTHGHGLGVLAIGPSPPPPLVDFIEEAQSRPSEYRRLFFALGHHVAARGREERHQADLARIHGELETLRPELDAVRSRAEAARAELTTELASRDALVEAIYSSRSWRMTAPVRALKRIARPVARRLRPRRRVSPTKEPLEQGEQGREQRLLSLAPDTPGRDLPLLALAGEETLPLELRDDRVIWDAQQWASQNAAALDLAHRAHRPLVSVLLPTFNTEPQFPSSVASEPAPLRSSTPDAADGRAPKPPVKLLAFYLPQFHPIPENDEWWGEGFTEWTNVRKAQPQFDGHFQPQLPTELGFYDLRTPEVLAAQADLARDHGIYGFCFYYYWFNGRRVLERPIDDMLERGLPKLPFCFCWANENWTRRWDGAEHDVLLLQEYEGDWADRFIRDVLPALLDERYVRVGDAPLLLVYRANMLPDARRVTQRWREIARSEAGIELHLAAVQSFGLIDPTEHGFDAAVEFPPHTEWFAADRSGIRNLVPEFDGYLQDYHGVMRNQLAKSLPPYDWYRGVMPAWDNTARRGHHGHVIVNTSPANYRLWLRKLVLQTLVRADVQEPLVFLNAWNEWGEGNHLEPDQRYGRQWLEATRSALADGVRQFSASLGFPMTEPQALAYLRLVLPAL